jgi:predicted transcriptional regulator
MTLILDSTSAKKISLLKELALELGVKVTETFTETSTNSKAENINSSLTVEQMGSIDAGLEDIKNGRVHTHEEVQEETKKRFPHLFNR